MTFEDFTPEGYASNERMRKFNDRDDRCVKVRIMKTTAQQPPDTQAAQESFKAEAFRVSADGSLVYPEKDKQAQPGYYAETRGVLRQAIADESLTMGNVIGELIARVAEKSDAIAVTSDSFNFPSD